MVTLASNLHLITMFYKPSSERFKIIREAKVIPSDQVRRPSLYYPNSYKLTFPLIVRIRIV